MIYINSNKCNGELMSSSSPWGTLTQTQMNCVYFWKLLLFYDINSKRGMQVSFLCTFLNYRTCLINLWCNDAIAVYLLGVYVVGTCCPTPQKIYVKYGAKTYLSNMFVCLCVCVSVCVLFVVILDHYLFFWKMESRFMKCTHTHIHV